MFDFQPDNVWVTADHHFFHAGILHPEHGSSRAARWDTLEEMHDALLGQWCETVGRRDLVIVIGDLLFRVGAAKAIELLRKLSGYQIVLFGGNHDDKLLRKLARRGDLPEHVSFVPVTLHEYATLPYRVEGKQALMRHVPADEWPGQNLGTLLLHGHSHGKKKLHPARLDVGWDVHGRLLSLADIQAHFALVSSSE